MNEKTYDGIKIFHLDIDQDTERIQERRVLDIKQIDQYQSLINSS